MDTRGYQGNGRASGSPLQALASLALGLRLWIDALALVWLCGGVQALCALGSSRGLSPSPSLLYVPMFAACIPQIHNTVRVTT